MEPFQILEPKFNHEQSIPMWARLQYLFAKCEAHKLIHAHYCVCGLSTKVLQTKLGFLGLVTFNPNHTFILDENHTFSRDSLFGP